MRNQAIPNSTLVTIPGAAHAAVFEAPERTNEAILNWANGIG
jgi:pimeloyl-ACP methyl ester carboxylesterase